MPGHTKQLPPIPDQRPMVNTRPNRSWHAGPPIGGLKYHDPLAAAAHPQPPSAIPTAIDPHGLMVVGMALPTSWWSGALPPEAKG